MAENNRFRVGDGHTQVLKKKTWKSGFNFTLDVTRVITGVEGGGIMLKLVAPHLPNKEL